MFCKTRKRNKTENSGKTKRINTHTHKENKVNAEEKYNEKSLIY